MTDRPPKAIFWPAFVVTLLLVTMAGSLSILWIANWDGGVQFQREYQTHGRADESRLFKELGWDVTVLDVRVSGQTTAVDLAVTDSLNQGLSLPSFQAEISRPDRTAMLGSATAQLIDASNGRYLLSIPVPKSSIWDLDLSLTHEGDTVRTSVRIPHEE